MVMMVDPGVSVRDAFFSVCETTEVTACHFSLPNALVERDSGGERGRKDREMIATGVSATPLKMQPGGTGGSPPCPRLNKQQNTHSLSGGCPFCS